MGFLQSASKFFKSSNAAIKRNNQRIGRDLARSNKSAAKFFNSVAIKGESVVATVYKDSKGFVQGVGQFATNNINQSFGLGNRLIDKSGDTISSLGKSLSMPLVIGAGLLGGIYLLGRK